MSARTLAVVAVMAGLLLPSVAVAQRTEFYQTPNFRVEAPTAETARLVAERAEECRKALAVDWLGRELPAWPQPCPVRVAVGFGPPGGASGFQFAAGPKPGVTAVRIAVAGPLEAILDGVLPHEVMHCVVTTHFGRPLPRWADEGLSILCEPAAIQAGADDRFRQLRADGRALGVKVLLELKDYPPDPLPVYLGGHSVARFLLTRPALGPAKDPGYRRKLLVDFFTRGLADGWAAAAKAVYGFESVEALEGAWADWLPTPAARPGR
jgi:hypothetical protein